MERVIEWRKNSEYNGDDDFRFPAVKDNGDHPIAPDMVLRRHIRPALKRLGIQKRIGWHSFRHGLGTMLRQHGVDLKTAQEPLRHTNARITMELYQQVISPEKRAGNAVAMRGLLGDSLLQYPSAPFSTRGGSMTVEVTPAFLCFLDDLVGTRRLELLTSTVSR
jgi:integrase